MRKVYYLSTCDTCKRILSSINADGLELIDIKSNPLTEKDVEEMFALTGSYDALFSKRAQLYKQLGLKDKGLEEKDFKHYLLDHYTFLKRPVFILNGEIFVGNSKKVIEQVQAAI